MTERASRHPERAPSRLPSTTRPVRRIATVVLAAAGVATALSTCSSCRSGPRDDSRPNVVFVLVDTLRADHLGSAGYPRDTSPNLDALATGAIRFSNARSQAPCTFPSVNSLLTSRWPAEFLPWPDDDAMGVPVSLPYLPVILKSAGYHTLAVSASPIFRSRNATTGYNMKADYEHGFDTFVDDVRWADARAVNARLAALLPRAPARPLFVYLHYIDPHSPYAAPQRRFAPSYSGKDFIAQGQVQPIADMLYEHGPPVAVTPRDIEQLRALYDDEIAHFDAALPELVSLLRQHSLWDRTILVVASDHGEEFLEHGHIQHCNCLYDTTLRVPLVLRIPRVRPALHADPVRNLDIVPTVLDYLAITPPPALHGRSLRDVIEGRAAERRSYAWHEGQLSVASQRFKLIRDFGTGRVELYDYPADPGETHDVATDRPRERDLLAADLAGREPKPPQGSQRDSLRALGYVQ